jgi:hypothetical protein
VAEIKESHELEGLQGKKSSKEKEEKRMFKEELQLPLDQLERNRSGSSKKYVQTCAEESRNRRQRDFVEKC